MVSTYSEYGLLTQITYSKKWGIISTSLRLPPTSFVLPFPRLIITIRLSSGPVHFSLFSSPLHYLSEFTSCNTHPHSKWNSSSIFSLSSLLSLRTLLSTGDAKKGFSAFAFILLSARNTVALTAMAIAPMTLRTSNAVILSCAMAILLLAHGPTNVLAGSPRLVGAHILLLSNSSP